LLVAERQSRFRVEHKIELGSLYHRQIGRPLTFENSGGVDTNLPIGIGNAHPIAAKAVSCSRYDVVNGLVPT
jgi:hypothetical protein